MTFIEFFSKEAVENLCSSLTQAPDRVIFLWDSFKQIKTPIENYEAFLATRGIETEVLFRQVRKNNRAPSLTCSRCL